MTFINFSQQVDKKAIFLLFGCYCINPRLILDEKYATNANDYPENFHRMIWGALVNIAKKGNIERISPIDIENELVEASRILSRHTPIKIRFIHVPNNSYSKTEIMRDIDLLRENENLQVVAVVADYLKGFKPVDNALESRIRIDNIVSDLRALAIECDVAVITASQVKIEFTNQVQANRAKYQTSVIPKDCPETIFSESKGVIECADFALVFAQTSDKYERNETTNAIKYTHLEALVLKTRAGKHNSARAFIPYVEGTQIAFQKDYGLLDEHNRPVWLTSPDLEFKGDINLIAEENSKAKGSGKLFSKNDKKNSLGNVSVECNIEREVNVMDSLPEFNNQALAEALK